MPARLTAYLPDRAAHTGIVRGTHSIRIGRSLESGFTIDHSSVSRAHAELVESEPGVWELTDLGSTNGMFVEDRRLLKARLTETTWLRFGDVYCQFEPISEQIAVGMEAQGEQQRSLTRAHSERLASEIPYVGAGHFGILLDDVLLAMLEIARCARGFVLLARGNEHAVAASRVLDARTMASRVFSGSVAVVRRVLAERSPVVINDVDNEAWLAGRPSVVAGGLCSIVCLPLTEGERLLGAIYMDRNSPGDPITALDLELIGDFTERASQWLRASQAMDQIGEMPLWRDVEASHVPLKR